jgi:hypothetical protein
MCTNFTYAIVYGLYDMPRPIFYVNGPECMRNDLKILPKLETFIQGFEGLLYHACDTSNTSTTVKASALPLLSDDPTF